MNYQLNTYETTMQMEKQLSQPRRSPSGALSGHSFSRLTKDTLRRPLPSLLPLTEGTWPLTSGPISLLYGFTSKGSP